jgi:hypothetical protein
MNASPRARPYVGEKVIFNHLHYADDFPGVIVAVDRHSLWREPICTVEIGGQQGLQLHKYRTQNVNVPYYDRRPPKFVGSSLYQFCFPREEEAAVELLEQLAELHRMHGITWSLGSGEDRGVLFGGIAFPEGCHRWTSLDNWIWGDVLAEVLAGMLAEAQMDDVDFLAHRMAQKGASIVRRHSGEGFSST